mgnify:CR=1 FL=1
MTEADWTIVNYPLSADGTRVAVEQVDAIVGGVLHEPVDLGTDKSEPRVDYPDKAKEIGAFHQYFQYQLISSIDPFKRKRGRQRFDEMFDKAIAKLEKQEFDLVISDIKMPDKTGYEVFSAVRRSKQNVPVILTSHGPTAVQKRQVRQVTFRAPWSWGTFGTTGWLARVGVEHHSQP